MRARRNYDVTTLHIIIGNKGCVSRYLDEWMPRLGKVGSLAPFTTATDVNFDVDACLTGDPVATFDNCPSMVITNYANIAILA